MGKGSASMSASMKGEKALLRALAAVEKDVSGSRKKFTRRALREGAKATRKQVKANAAAATNPANQTDLMQRVARGTKIRSAKRSRRHFGVRIVTPSREQLGLPPYSRKGPGRYYAPAHVELGTKRTPAQPFMRSALAATTTRAIRVIKVTLWRLIRGETVKYRR